MKVKDLISQLDRFDDECEVLMSKDDEGNEFRHVGDLELFEVYEVDGNETYRRDVPENIKDDAIVMIWPGY